MPWRLPNSAGRRLSPALLAIMALCVILGCSATVKENKGYASPSGGRPPWAERDFDDTSVPGSVLIAGQGLGPTREEAGEKAKADALEEAASIIEVQVDGQFDGIQEEFRRAGNKGESTSSLDIARSTTHIRTRQSLRGAVVRPPVYWGKNQAGQWICCLRIEIPRKQVFPQERLSHLLSEPGSAADRAEQAMRLAKEYLVEGQGDLAALSARAAALWAPDAKEPLRLLADIAAQNNDLIGGIAALERLADLSDPRGKAALTRRIERLRKNLLSPDEVIGLIKEACGKRARPRDFSFAAEPAGNARGFVFSFSSREGGYITSLWIDGDGVAEWTLKEAGRGNNRWGDGGHVLQPVTPTLPGPVTVIALLTPAPLSFENMLPIPTRPAAGGSGERLRRLYLLKKFLEDVLADSENKTAVVSFRVP